VGVLLTSFFRLLILAFFFLPFFFTKLSALPAYTSLP